MTDEIDDSALLHRQAYDPQKAHAYYLQTRHLKGRARRPNLTVVKDTPRRSGPPAKAKMSSAALHQDVQGQRAALEKRLQHLKDELAKLVEAAKKRSGIDTKPSTTKKSSTTKKTTSNTPKKHMTAAQKKAQAERAKKARAKNPPPKKTSQPSIADLEKQIAEYRQKIEAAIADARKKTTSKTAPKGR